jgi:N6-adenosine-specific RNA methylase IME4
MSAHKIVPRLEDLVDDGVKFGTIYADPPWRYGNQATRAATGNHYAGKTISEICELPIADIVADSAHLHLWTTNGFLFEAREIIEAWGFEYKSCLVWCKPQMGIGNYWRVSHEFMLLGVRGSCRFQKKDKMSWLEIPRGKHSAKPEKIRHIIEEVSPGPRLELYARSTAPGWHSWGNQIENTLFNLEAAQ